MVVNHVKHHLQPGVVQRIDHGAELGAGIAGRAFACVARLGRTPGHRAVAPVVAQALCLQPCLVGPVRHRHQAHGGDTQTLQMGQHRWVRQAGIAAALVGRYIGVQRSEALDMQLIHHTPGRVKHWPGWAGLWQVGHHTGLERGGRVVAQVGQIAQRAMRVVAQVQVVAAVAAQHSPGSRVEQQLGRVEPVALVRGPGTVHAPAVHQACTNARPQRQRAAPDAALWLRQAQAGCLVLARGVKQAQLHRRGVGRGQGKLNGIAAKLGAQQAAMARTQGRRSRQVSVGCHASGCSTMHASGGKSRQRDCARCCQGSASVAPGALGRPLPP